MKESCNIFFLFAYVSREAVSKEMKRHQPYFLYLNSLTLPAEKHGGYGEKSR